MYILYQTLTIIFWYLVWDLYSTWRRTKKQRMTQAQDSVQPTHETRAFEEHDHDYGGPSRQRRKSVELEEGNKKDARTENV
jgi:hypothetical protein